MRVYSDGSKYRRSDGEAAGVGGIRGWDLTSRLDNDTGEIRLGHGWEVSKRRRDKIHQDRSPRVGRDVGYSDEDRGLGGERGKPDIGEGAS